MIESIFFISIPSKISGSGSLLHMMKVWENLKLAMQRCNVALPSEDIADQSAFFTCTAAGSILVLYWSSILLWMLVHTSERAAPEWIRGLNRLLVCTVTVGKSDSNSMV